MTAIKQDKIIVFGAGKIGRSFIGQLFSRGGFEVVFIDVDHRIIDELNRRRNYNVIIKSVEDLIINIKNVRGVFAEDEVAVSREIATAGIVAISVGLHGLAGIFPLLAKGLMTRYETDPAFPLDIIIAENMRDADAYFKKQLGLMLDPSYPFDRLVGLVETSIGKMVPIMPNKDLEDDILQVFAEPYNTLILDKQAFKNPIPSIEGLAPKENMKAWVDRKLFIHNLGHASAAYIGYLCEPGFTYLHEVLAVDAIYDQTRGAMLQSAEILRAKYPGEFSPEDLDEHIDDLLNRFRNKALGDTIFRVGSDLIRKLGSEDRIAGAIKEAIGFNLPYDKILFALVCGFHFRATDENGEMLPHDIQFVKIFEKGIDHILSSVCGFDPADHARIFDEARAMDQRLAIRSRVSQFVAKRP